MENRFKGREIVATEPLTREYPTVFLAGTIDNGNSEDWQSVAAKNLVEKGFIVYNPRRKNWNPDWNAIANESELRTQIEWELEALEKASLVIFNFLPNSKSPITLMELGLYAKETKIVVCCPSEFYRSNNVKIVCEKYQVPVYYDFEDLLNSFNNLNK